MTDCSRIDGNLDVETAGCGRIVPEGGVAIAKRIASRNIGIA
ncbi:MULTISPECIES: hypothetical protein [Microcoleaceae]|nr:hypothetical protein [Lyngbya sp. CCAP 1446/10]